MRFYELDGGRITLDGQRHRRDAAARAARANIGMVLQDTWLFGGTIRDNIAYGNLDATEEQIREAARATYVDRFVHSLPDGYDTVIDDEGGTVSAGEKQLLTIARAFLADPTILILDEATSSVDTRTEVLIQQAMAALRSQRTSFVIAHRLSTIRDADMILVMEAGRIVEQGNHDELLARGRGLRQPLQRPVRGGRRRPGRREHLRWRPATTTGSAARPTPRPGRVPAHDRPGHPPARRRGRGGRRGRRRPGRRRRGRGPAGLGPGVGGGAVRGAAPGGRRRRGRGGRADGPGARLHRQAARPAAHGGRHVGLLLPVLRRHRPHAGRPDHRPGRGHRTPTRGSSPTGSWPPSRRGTCR